MHSFKRRSPVYKARKNRPLPLIHQQLPEPAYIGLGFLASGRGAGRKLAYGYGKVGFLAPGGAKRDGG